LRAVLGPGVHQLRPRNWGCRFSKNAVTPSM
jgi:hypothetical protein